MASVTINLAGLNENAGFGVYTGKGNGKDGQVKNGSIFAGNINGGMADLIEQKRAQARKQATKIIRDQFARDNEITNRMNEMRARNEEIAGELSIFAKQRNAYIEEQEALKEQYGVAPDSQEQKDLELLRKAGSSLKDGKFEGLSEEEVQRLANMGEPTQYQRRALAYDKVIRHITSMEAELLDEKMANTASIQASKQAILEAGGKGIRNAKKAAESVLQAASDAVIGMLWEDAKKHVEEELEKVMEAAKEQAEKKEEQEEKLEAIKEKKEEQEDLAEVIRESASEQTKLQDEIKKIMKEAELLEEDMKGLLVDGTM